MYMAALASNDHAQRRCRHRLLRSPARPPWAWVIVRARTPARTRAQPRRLAEAAVLLAPVANRNAQPQSQPRRRPLHRRQHRLHRPSERYWHPVADVDMGARKVQRRPLVWPTGPNFNMDHHHYFNFWFFVTSIITSTGLAGRLCWRTSLNSSKTAALVALCCCRSELLFACRPGRVAHLPTAVRSIRPTSAPVASSGILTPAAP